MKEILNALYTRSYVAMKILEVSRSFSASNEFSYNRRYKVIRSCESGRGIILL